MLAFGNIGPAVQKPVGKLCFGDHAAHPHSRSRRHEHPRPGHDGGEHIKEREERKDQTVGTQMEHERAGDRDSLCRAERGARPEMHGGERQQRIGFGIATPNLPMPLHVSAASRHWTVVKSANSARADGEPSAALRKNILFVYPSAPFTVRERAVALSGWSGLCEMPDRMRPWGRRTAGAGTVPIARRL